MKEINTSPPTNIRWIIFAFSVGTSWLLYLHRYTFGFIRLALEEKYHFSNQELGYLESAFYWPYALAQVPSGVLCDLFGAHVFVGGSIVTWSFMLLAMTTTGSLPLLLIARALFGLSQAGTYPSLAKVTRVWFPPQTRTFIQGWIASFGGRSGAALSPILYSMFLIGVLCFSWQTALVIFAVVGLIFGSLFLAFFRSSPEEDARVNDAEKLLIEGGELRSAKPLLQATKGFPIARMATHWTLWIFALQQFFNAGADIIFVGHLPSYFKTELGIDMKASPAALAMFVSLPFLGGALGGVCGGFLNDWLIARTGNRRWSRSGVAIIGNIFACILLLIVVRQGSPWGVALSLMATKFFTDWTQPTCWGACTDIGGRFSASVMGIINTAGNLGAAVMPLVFGFALDYFKTEQMLDGQMSEVTNYKPVLMIGGALFLLSAASWFLIDCTKSLEEAGNE